MDERLENWFQKVATHLVKLGLSDSATYSLMNRNSHADDLEKKYRKGWSAKRAATHLRKGSKS